MSDELSRVFCWFFSLQVKIAPELPPGQRHETWRLPLYRLWHLLWFQIFEAYRLDHMWDWMRGLDTTQLFPGWQVNAVGTVLLTEHSKAVVVTRYRKRSILRMLSLANIINNTRMYRKINRYLSTKRGSNCFFLCCRTGCLCRRHLAICTHRP